MRKLLPIVALGGIVFVTGCVADSQYRDLEQAYRRSQERVVELQNRVEQLEQEIAMLEAAPEDAADRIAALRAERDELLERLDGLQARYEELAAREPIVLEPEVDEALRELADRHSDIVEYDPDRGMLKFRSDLTFDLGSAELTSGAEETLQQLAGILNEPLARQYEVRVAGHTDSVPIGRPETRERHPTNWHLSVHRAISVRDALETGGVAALRTSIQGHSKYRPVARNTPSGAEPNRRVEIYLLPMPSVNEQYLGGSGQSRQGGQSGSAQQGSVPLK